MSDLGGRSLNTNRIISTGALGGKYFKQLRALGRSMETLPLYFSGSVCESKVSFRYCFASVLPPHSPGPKALEFAQLRDFHGCQNKQDSEHQKNGQGQPR